MSDERTIRPATGPLHGAVRVTGSKSISNRALMIASLARGRSTVRGLLRSDDTDAMLAALQTLGINVARNGDDVEIEGVAGKPRALDSACSIDCGHGGTPARFLLALACLIDAPVLIDGSTRLRERPMADGIELLRTLGADIACLGEDGCLPVRVDSGSLRGGEVRVGATASSQFLSALMLIAPFLDDGIELTFESAPTSEAYIRLTASELERWGAGVELTDDGGVLSGVRVRPGMIASCDRDVPPDASSAVYWAVAASIVPGSRVQLLGLHADDPQPDMGVFDAIMATGAVVESEPDGVLVHGPRSIRGWSTIDASRMPDGAVAMAAMAACALTVSTITGLETLRVKESDRISAIKAELERCGAEVVATDRSLRIGPIPSTQLDPDAPSVSIRTYDDHRMAMAFAVLGLRRGGIGIIDPGCVSKSYPSFFEDLERLRG